MFDPVVEVGSEGVAGSGPELVGEVVNLEANFAALAFAGMTSLVQVGEER